jgi:hypothetical protein
MKILWLQGNGKIFAVCIRLHGEIAPLMLSITTKFEYLCPFATFWAAPLSAPSVPFQCHNPVERPARRPTAEVWAADFWIGSDWSTLTFGVHMEALSTLDGYTLLQELLPASVKNHVVGLPVSPSSWGSILKAFLRVFFFSDYFLFVLVFLFGSTQLSENIAGPAGRPAGFGRQHPAP